MGHLKSFILDGSHDYTKLAPALSHLVDNQQEFLCLALARDKAFGLGFISAKMHSSDIQQLEKNTSYTIEWWDIDKGEWTNKTVLNTNGQGLLKMPAKPDDRGWAYRIMRKL